MDQSVTAKIHMSAQYQHSAPYVVKTTIGTAIALTRSVLRLLYCVLSRYSEAGAPVGLPLFDFGPGSQARDGYGQIEFR
jgi:hypothetical protein